MKKRARTVPVAKMIGAGRDFRRILESLYIARSANFNEISSEIARTAQI